MQEKIFFCTHCAGNINVKNKIINMLSVDGEYFCHTAANSNTIMKEINDTLLLFYCIFKIYIKF